MRTEYGKALRDLFTARMRTELSAWRAVTPPKSHYWPGERVFVLDQHPAAWLIVTLVPNAGEHDAFEVEIGWSVLHRVPELSMRPSPEDPRDSETLRRDEYACRLANLVPDRSDTPGGWVIDPRTYSMDAHAILAALTERQTKRSPAEARAIVQPFVDDAMTTLLQVGVPYLESRLPLLAR